jgi:hypothetical protein
MWCDARATKAVNSRETKKGLTVAPIDHKFILEMDGKLIAEDVKLHARPFHVVTAWMSEKGIKGDVLDKRIWKPLMSFYQHLYPNESFSMPPLLIGGVGLRDRIYSVRVDLIYGGTAIDPIECIDIDPDEISMIFRYYPEQFWRAFYGVCDLWDFAYGVHDLISLGSPARDLLQNARSSLVAISRTLSGDLDIDSAVQSACLTAELSIKAALLHTGTTEAQLKKLSHRLPFLADAVIDTKPTVTDDRLRRASSRFPDYVATRYSLHGLKRIELVELGMRAQFVAADVIRRISGRSVGTYMELKPECQPRPEP